MKKIAIFILFCFSLTTFNSCDSDDSVVFIAQEAEGLSFTNSFLSEYILTPATASNLGERFTWNSVDFGVPTNVSYDLLRSNTQDFTESQLIDTTSDNELAITIGDMLGYAAELGLDADPDTPEPNSGTVFVRLRAYVGTGGNETFSDVQSLNLILPESDEIPVEELPMLAVPGNHQGWDPASATRVAAEGIGQTNYEGYAWLDGGYKFVAPDADGNFAWGNTDWGDDGTFTGVLVETGEVDCVADVAGYYRINANTTDLTYSISPANWGVLGNATPTGWDSDTDMVYDATTGLWTVTLDLTEQTAPNDGLKFRANDNWALNLGDTGADGSLEYEGDNIGVPQSGTYLITLDLRNPRQYTYSLELQ